MHYEHFKNQLLGSTTFPFVTGDKFSERLFFCSTYSTFFANIKQETGVHAHPQGLGWPPWSHQIDLRVSADTVDVRNDP